MARLLVLALCCSALVPSSRAGRYAAHGRGGPLASVGEDVAELAPQRAPRQRRAWRRRGCQALAAMGLLGNAPRAATAAGLNSFESMDTDADGAVDKEEFMLYSRDALNADGAQDKEFRSYVYRLAETLYDIGDVNRDGVLGRSEVGFIASLIGSEIYAVFSGSGRGDGDDTIHSVEDEFGGAHARSMLQELDWNLDGRVQHGEFAAAFRGAMQRHSWPEEALKDPRVLDAIRTTFDEADMDGDGTLGVRELQYAMVLTQEFAIKEMTQDIFAALDANNDGRITYDETLLASERPRQHHMFPVQTVAAAFMETFGLVDANDDGSLDLEETMTVAKHILPGFKT